MHASDAANESKRSFVPAAGRDWLLPLYDPFQWIFRGDSYRTRLIAQAEIRAGTRVLDVGCGTGSLVVQIARLQPGAEVVGLDPDPKALRIAERKARRAGVAVRLERGFSDALPFAESRFDRVFSSFMFHHLGAAEKSATLREIRRVLAPGGSLHLLDFGPPRGALARAVGHLGHPAEHLRDNLEGRIPVLMAEAGLAEPCEVDHRGTLVGSLAYYRAENA